MVKPPQKGFIQYKKKGRYYLRCAKTVQTKNGIIQCSYTIRKDTQKQEHICEFSSLDCYKSDDDIESRLAAKVSQIPLAEEMADFIDTTNISFRAACSPPMTKLLRAAFNLGKHSGEKTAEDAVPHVSRQAMTAFYIKKATNKQENALNKLKNCYVCISLDASTDISQNCLDVCVSHPFLHPKPIVINSVSKFGGTTDDYRNEINNSVSFLKNKGIKVAGITSDNCRAQVQAVSQISENSFQYKSSDPNDKTIVWISCICHVLALGVTHFLEEPEVQEMVDDFKKLVIELRKKPIRQFLKSTCIAPSNTRWNILFQQMLWIIKHNSEIISLYKSKSAKLQEHLDVIKPLIEKTFLIIIPAFIPGLQLVSAASREAEADSFAAAYVIPLLTELKESLSLLPKFINQRYINNSSYQQFVQSNLQITSLLHKNIEQMFQKHASGRLLKLMYVLTPQGRAEFRAKFSEVIINQDPREASVGRRNFNKRDDEQNAIISFFDNIEEIKTKLIEKEGSELSSDSFPEDSSDIMLSSDDENSDDPPEETINELAELNEDASINEDDPLSSLTSVLEEQLILIHDKTEVNQGIQSLLNWLMLSCDELNLTPIIEKSPVCIWTFLQTKKEWKILSNFALRCFSLVASEAGVERIFSQHKLIIDHLRRNTSKELRIARLNMKLNK